MTESTPATGAQMKEKKKATMPFFVVNGGAAATVSPKQESRASPLYVPGSGSFPRMGDEVK